MRQLIFQKRKNSTLYYTQIIFEWRGNRVKPQENRTISTYNDHRMAMSFAPAAIKFPELKIQDPDVVSKSYPNFWNDLKSIGVEVWETS